MISPPLLAPGRWGLVSLLILGAFGWAHSTSLQSAGGLDDPVATVNQFRGALQDGSVAQVLALLAPDVLIFEAGEQETSRDDYAAHHLKADIAFLAKVYVDTLGQTSRVEGNTAWVTTRSRLVSREPDPRPPTTVTETVVLRRVVANWQIVHVHWSSSSVGDPP